MAKINQPPPKTPMWPWGAPSQVRNRLVDRTQLTDKPRGKNKKGDPKNPALASFALLDFIGPAHSADELRLPEPPMPEGHEADVEGYLDREAMSELKAMGDAEVRRALEKSLTRVNAPPDRVDRLKNLLAREAQMLQLMGRIFDDVDEVQRRIREEQKEGKY